MFEYLFRTPLLYVQTNVLLMVIRVTRRYLWSASNSETFYLSNTLRLLEAMDALYKIKHWKCADKIFDIVAQDYLQWTANCTHKFNAKIKMLEQIIENEKRKES